MTGKAYIKLTAKKLEELTIVEYGELEQLIHNLYWLPDNYTKKYEGMKKNIGKIIRIMYDMEKLNEN